jgi:PKD repeat protein
MLGTGAGSNTSTTYPAPYGNWYWGAKHQILIKASELNTAGMTAGNINSLAFNVQTPEGSGLQNYEIGIKHTGSSAVTGFESGFTNVFGPATFTPSAGWNTHTFSSSFYWDGIQNLLIDVCFNNASFTGNDIMLYTSSTFNSVAYSFQDASGVCASPGFTQTSSNRPDIQFDWTIPSIPPISEFSASTLSTCSGDVCFTDLSTNSPTEWLWDFGDGNTDTTQNPCHTYTTTGNYNVSLLATNAFGSDIEIKSGLINVNLSGATPVAASCTPNTLNNTLGFGISNVEINTINNASGGSAEGYGDFTCQQTTLFAGQSYPFEVIFSGPSTLTGAAWIDFNNDGVLNDATEKVIDVTSAMNMNGTITIPSSAVLNQPLRLRVSADYDFSAMPTPCSDSDFGQAEDYTVIIEQDTSPPVTSFTSDVIATCDGIVNFEDLSSNIPIGWLWDFGDGNTDIAENPTHTYLINGSYTVTLTSYNAFGSGTSTIVGYINVTLGANVSAPACTPASLAYCCDYGIYKVELNTINNSSPDAIEGYQDYSCAHNTQLDEGSTYNLEVRTGPINHDTKVWIDYNNDGTFDDLTEMIMDAPSQVDPSVNYTVPVGISTLHTPLRMRVMSDIVASITDACSDQTYGQTEDYGVKIVGAGGIDQNGLFYEIALFPNPAEDVLNVKVLSGEKIGRWVLADITGRVINASNSSNNSTTIDVSELSPGQYLVVLSINDVMVSKPFIKL